MNATAEFVHHVPGRLRVRLHGKRGDTGFFSALTEQIARLAGVLHVKFNVTTGSIVIGYTGTLEQLVHMLLRHGLTVQGATTHRSAPAPAHFGVKPLHLVSNRDINPMFMLGTLLAMLGLVQTVRGKILVPSISLIWYAMDTFRASQSTVSRPEAYRVTTREPEDGSAGH